MALGKTGRAGFALAASFCAFFVTADAAAQGRPIGTLYAGVPDGEGNGTAAVALNPKPRNFTDPAWQKSVTDQHLRDTMVKGGAGVGKSALMPPQPLLAKDPETLEALVKLVRGFEKKSTAVGSK